jgi:putative nucleotidyltransferase with HDIG domain
MSFTIDEDLWFGGRSDEDAQQNAAESLAALSARVHGVRPFPLAAQRLLDVTADEHATIHEVSQVVEADPALGAKLLRLVNSSAFGLRIPCKSIGHAVSLLGLKKLGELAAAGVVLDMFEDEVEENGDRILRHGAAVAAIARHLAPSVSLSSEEMFIAGLLHDVGKLMMLQSEEDGYAELLEECTDKWDAMHAHEQAAYGFDHAVLGGYVLREWRIPEPLPRVVAWHHSPTKAYEVGGRVGAMIHLLRLADRLAYEVAASPRPTSPLLEELGRGESASYLGLSPNVLELAWPKLERLARESSMVLRDPDAIPESTIGVVQGDNDQTLSLDERMLLTNATSVTLSATRQEAIVLGCVVCSESTGGAVCPRCRGPVCARHNADELPWCSVCEGEYETIAPPSGLASPFLRAAIVCGVLGAGAVALGPFTTAATVDHVAVLGLIGTMIAAAAHGYLQFATRSRFLANRPSEPRVPKE